MKEYELLGNVQKLDIELDKLSERLAHLPEQDEFEILKEQLASTEKLLEQKQTVLTRERSALKKLEGELELLDLKIKHEDNKLYSGTIANPKELKSIQEEVGILKGQRDDMETELLELLDKVDNLDSEAKELSSRIEDLEGEVKEAEEMYKKVKEDMEKETADLESEREKIKSDVSDSLLAVYEEVRKQKKQAAVIIADGVCQGCFVELPAEEVDKMLQTDKLWRCPQCRRILLR